jgi:hypothetical protein
MHHTYCGSLVVLNGRSALDTCCVGIFFPSNRQLDSQPAANV